MFRFVCTSLLFIMVVHAHAQPLSCGGDEHCAEGYYCETEINICRECFRCEDFNRQPPKLLSECIKSLDRCGLCNKGYIFRNGAKGKCVLPEYLEFGNGSHYRYLCLIAVAVGLAFVATSMYIIKQIAGFRVVAVAYYDDVGKLTLHCTPILSRSHWEILAATAYDQNNNTNE
ncbi:uncharacterized protein LOC111358256 isoform X1 [Spodoptera litura]|uniref:Uncharacterized protein LOC111358256 isoform X1 n=2 Tax=Spodoptera litura TaxID=69820 RepID=A0A9J7EE04_SPOLT|nr:uncharacterized protein LOC111358256 isoform X1 [Spodoptera litura]